MPKNSTEYEECVVLAEYLDLKGYTYSHIAQETFTKNWGTKMKNKKQGVRKGVPDYIIIVKSKLVFIEMKRKGRSVVSLEQANWIDKLNKCNNVYAYVCKGADDAIMTIEKVKSIV